MSRLFCDTSYFVALVYPRDQHHQAAVALEPVVEASDLATTEEVLIELLNFFSGAGRKVRTQVSLYARQLLLNPKFTIIGRNDLSFLEGLELYESRPDKGYSLTECISMNVCRELGIEEVLTSDNHFVQEGLRILL